MSRTHSPSGRRYLTYDPYELHEQIWSGFSGDVGWDVGANCGQSTQKMLQSFSKVLAFEPCMESYHWLAGDWSSDSRVRVFQLALSDHVGQIELSVTHAIAGGQLLSPALIGTNDWFSGEVSRRKVPCMTLDSLVVEHGAPDFVKIDAEGGEDDILAGGSELLARETADFLVEFHSAELLDVCLSRLSRYQVEMVGNSGGSGWIKARPVKGESRDHGLAPPRLP